MTVCAGLKIEACHLEIMCICYFFLWSHMRGFDTCHGLKGLKTHFLLLLAMGFCQNVDVLIISSKSLWGFFFHLFEHYWLIWSGQSLAGRSWCHIHSMHQSQSKNIHIRSDYSQRVANVARSDPVKQISWVFRYLILIIRNVRACIITTGAPIDWALIVIGRYR